MKDPLSKCPIRTRRNLSATRVKGRIRNHRTIANVTVTISTTVATIHQKLLPPEVVTLIPYVSSVHQDDKCADKAIPVMQRKHFLEPLDILRMPECIDLRPLLERSLNLGQRQQLDRCLLGQRFKGRMRQGLKNSGRSCGRNKLTLWIVDSDTESPGLRLCICREGRRVRSCFPA